MSAFSWAATVVVGALAVSFVAYLISLRRLSLQIRRPPVEYDRLGHLPDDDDRDWPAGDERPAG